MYARYETAVKKQMPPIFASMKRAGMATLAYLLTSLVLLAAAVLMKRSLAPEVTQISLSVVFVATLVSGLEPGTAKAAAVKSSADGPPKAMAGLFWASCAKALIAAPILALLWRVSAPMVPWTVLSWLPLIVLTGFVATDFRVLFDVRGEHSAAIWLKQGPIAASFACLAALLLTGQGIAVSVGCSTVLRLVLTLAFLAWRLEERPFAMTRAAWANAKAMLRDSRWPHFALVSVLAALSGSLDRFVALRTLSATDYNLYFIVFEVLSKFWLLAYLAGPVVFARRATGAISKQTMALVHLGIWCVGLLYLLAISMFYLGWPSEARVWVGDPGPGLPALLALGGAIVISSSAQLNLIDIQARGGRWMASGLTGVSLISAGVLFAVCSHHWGFAGLLWAWLAKSTIELVLGLAALGRMRRD
jgi:hypothetical protein